MEVKAHLRFLRIAPRKVRLVVNLIKGLPVDRAVDQLTILPKRSAQPVLKLLNSAVANAEHNFQLDRKGLVVKTAIANEGPKLKRYRPRAFGRAAEILKRTSHVTIVLEGKQPVKSAKVKAADKPTNAPVKLAASSVKRAPAKPSVQKAPHSRPMKAKDQEKKREAEDTIVPRKGES